MPSRIEKHTFFRILLGVWTIMGVILTNGYNGIMISELNSPRKQSHPKFFDDLICKNRFRNLSKIWNPDNRIDDEMVWYFQFHDTHEEMRDLSHVLYLIKYFNMSVDINTTNVDSSCFRLLSQFKPVPDEQVQPEFFSLLLNLATDSQDSNLNTYRGALKLFASNGAFFPVGFSYLSQNLNSSVLQKIIERQVVKCEKTVFIAKSPKIKIEYEFLSRKYPHTHFVVSSQTLLSYPIGISVPNGLNPRVLTGFKSQTETGVWAHTEDYEIRGNNINRTAAIPRNKGEYLKPKNIASLKGTWITLFILVGFSISSTIPLFAIECRRYVGLLISKIYRVFLLRRHQKSTKMALNDAIGIAVAICDAGNIHN